MSTSNTLVQQKLIQSQVPLKEIAQTRVSVPLSNASMKKSGIAQQGKTHEMHKFDKLLSSAQYLLKDSSIKMSSLKTKSQMLNATEQIVTTLEKSIDSLQQTLAMLDGVKCNEEERLERVTSIFGNAEKILVECEDVLKHLLQFQDTSRTMRQKFHEETVELQSKYGKFEQYAFKVQNERADKLAQVQNEQREMNDIEAQIQIANEQIIKSRQMFELKKGEREELKHEYSEILIQKNKGIQTMDSELYHVGQLKRTCTELHDQIMKVEDLIKEEEDIITKHRIDICKLSECENLLKSLSLAADSLDKIEQLPDNIAQLFNRLDVVHQIAIEKYDEFIMNIKKKLVNIVQLKESIATKSKAYEEEEKMYKEEERKCQEFKQEYNKLQHDHYIILANVRMVEQENRKLSNDRDIVQKELNQQNELLLNQTNELQEFKEQVFELKKAIKKAKAEHYSQKRQLENESQSLDNEKTSVKKEISKVDLERKGLTEKLEQLVNLESDLIANSSNLEEQLRQSKQREEIIVRKKKEELTTLSQILVLEECKSRELFEKRDNLEKQLEELASSKQYIHRKATIEREIEEYEASLKEELEQETRKLREQFQNEWSRKEEELKPKYSEIINNVKLEMEKAEKKLEEEKAFLHDRFNPHNKKQIVSSYNDKKIATISQNHPLPPKSPAPVALDFSIIFENDKTKDDEDDLFKSPQHQGSMDKDQKDYTPHAPKKIQKPRNTKSGSTKRRVLSKRTSITKMATTEEIESWFNE